MVLNATEYLVQHGFRIVLTILPAYLHHKEWQSFICAARTSTFWWNFIVWLCRLASLQLIHVHAAQSVCTVNKSLQILHCLGFSETRWSLWCALFFAIILDICSLLRCFVPNLSSTLNSWLSYYNAANFQKTHLMKWVRPQTPPPTLVVHLRPIAQKPWNPRMNWMKPRPKLTRATTKSRDIYKKCDWSKAC